MFTGSKTVTRFTERLMFNRFIYDTRTQVTAKYSMHKLYINLLEIKTGV